MLKLKVVRSLAIALGLVSASAQAMNLDWKGGYRFEWTEVDRPSLATPGQRKAYGLNSLYLSPKIIAADGFNIVSRFDVLANNDYPNSQLGEIWGRQSPSNESAPTTTNQGAGLMQVSQLYLNISQEYGSLILGRAPFEFGLGMTYNAGGGSFDHWYDTRDMVAYKVLIGDWFIMPVISRKQTAGFGQGGTLASTGFQIQYENEENKSLIGVYQENLKGAQNVLQYTDGQRVALGGTIGATIGSDLNIQRTNFVLSRTFDSFGFKMEAGFQSGNTGIVTAGNAHVKYNGYGIATEFFDPNKDKKYDFSLKMGIATGDDAGATDFGGYIFNRNYNLGMLLFNHRLGGKDYFGTDVINGKGSAEPDGTYTDVGNTPDVEAISNAIYIAPSMAQKIGDHMDLRHTVVYAQLMNPLSSSIDSSKNLGLEYDIELIYKATEKIQWVNQLGILLPGDAWKNGIDNLENEFTYGIESKAAISF